VLGVARPTLNGGFDVFLSFSFCVLSNAFKVLTREGIFLSFLLASFRGSTGVAV
jgi:hypothetical protein